MKWISHTLLLVAIAAIPGVLCSAATVVIKSGNVVGSSVNGAMAHHIQQTQLDFAKLVAVETDGEVDLQILEGKRADIPVFNMPAMTADGSMIQACVVPSFFLPRVFAFKIFEIPYLFRDKAHAAKYPNSELARLFSSRIEDAYDVKVLAHFLVAHNVSITSTDKPMELPEDFSGRYINDDFESFAPMWVNVKPAKRYSIGFTAAAIGEHERLN